MDRADGPTPGRHDPGTRPLLSRRGVLAGAAVAGFGLLTGCAPGGSDSSPTSTAPASPSSGASGGAPSSAGGATSTGSAATSTTADGGDVVRGPSTAPRLALTFHGQGDPGIATAVLDACRAADARITVFAIGQWAAANPDLVRRIADAGHDVGNHTWSHQEMPSLDAATAATEVSRAAEALTRILGYPGRWFRPSGTQYSTPTIRAAASASGYPRCISYDVDPLDYQDPGVAAVRAGVAAGLHAGAIVSLHLGHPGTAEALPMILSDIRTAGLSAVTMTHLLGGS